MKSKCSSILKVTTALVLAVLMMVGSISSVIGATVGVEQEESALVQIARKIVDIADTGRNADLAETGGSWIAFKRLYFGVPTSWSGSFTNLYAASRQTNGYCVIIGKLTEQLSGSRIYGTTTGQNINHSGWGAEYLYIFASDTSYTVGTGYSNLTVKSNYATTTSTSSNYVNITDLNSTSNTYFIYPKSDATGCGIGSEYTNYDNFGFLDGTASPHFKQTVSSSSGGSSTISGYRVKNENTSFEATSATDSYIYPFVGSKVTITATANSGYELDGFYSDSSYSTKITSGVSGNTYTYTVTSTSAKTTYVKYKSTATTYTDITAVAKGTTDGSNYSVSLGTIQSSTTVSASTGLAVSAGTQSGYTFYKWVASGSGTFDDATSASTTFHPAADSEIATAQYKKNYTFSNDTTDTHGTVTVPSGTVLAGASYSGTVTPADGYKIKTLTVGGIAVSDAVGKTSAYTYSGTTGSSTTGTTTPISVVATFEANTAMNLYIAGRFHVKDSNGNWVNTFDSGDWNATSTKIPFTYLSGTTYKVDTNATLAELSGTISSYDPVFFVYDKTETTAKNWYASSATTMSTSGTTLVSSGGANNNLKFSSSSTDGPVTVYYDSNTHKIWYTIPDFYDVTVNTATGGSVTASPSRAEEGAEITLTVNPTAGYQLTSLTAKDADNDTVTITNNKFTMPAKNVTVTPVFSEITSKPHLIGPLDSAGSWIEPGDEMTSSADGTSFTITRENVPAGTYQFKHLSWNGTSGIYNYTEIDAANQTLNGIATLSAVDDGMRGNNYQIVTTVPADITLVSDGTKFTSITVVRADATNATTLYAKDGAAPINWDNKTAGGASDLTGTAYNYAAIATTEIVSINENPVTATSTSVGNDSSKYQTYNVEAGQVVSIKTTIASAYRSRYYVRGFCVNGVTYYGGDGKSNNSDVNTTVNSTNGVYTLTYVVPTPAEGADLDPIEITPIYYMTDTGKDGVTFITFYLQGYRDVVDEGWGNTPYVYPFYGDLGNVNNAYGAYPGQPMVNISGTYSIEVPLKNVTINNGLSTYKTTNIKGVTVNNGYADHVHRNLIYHWSTGTDSGDDKDHKQTYDYDDFFKIYEEKNDLDGKTINSITFRMMYEDTTYNADEYGYLALKDPRIHGTKSTLSAAEIETIRSSKNGWEQLTNYFNENTDIFGTKLTGTTGDPIYAISTGYNASIAGDYGTAWMIYVPDSSGTGYHLLTDADKGRYAIPPSLLFFNDTNSFSKTTLYPDARHNVVGPGDYTDSITDYKAIYDALKADYTNRPVFVSYEMDHQDTRNKAAGTGAYRMDGHWYYTFTGDYVSSDIKIQYWDNTQQAFVDDAYTSGGVTGTTTGTKAYFTANADGTGAQTTTSGNKVMQSGYYYFSAEEATNWQFVGWYVQHGSSSPEPMTGVPMSQASVLAESSGTIIARFEPITRGDLTIYHDVDPESAGAGTATISAVVKNGASTVATYPSSGTASSVYIPQDYITNEHSDYTIEVTLTATPTLDDAWDKFTYDSKMTPDSPTLAGGGSGIAKTSTFSFTVGDLFSNGDLKFKTLNYYSSFTATPHYYNITYNYTDRFNSAKSFTVCGTFSASDYSKYVTVDGNTRTVSGTFVKTVAPFLSNFNQNLNLNFSGASITQSYSGYTHSISATLGSEGTTYKAMFALPYSYYDAAGVSDLDGNRVKKYTGVQENLVVGEQTMNIVKKTDINYVSVNNIAYEDYFTSNGAQTNVSKDSETVNHVNNDFITAPSQIAVQDEGKSTYHMEYFKCWSVYDYNDHDTLVTQVLYPDFHYRAYGNYYIVPEYSANKNESFALNDFENNVGANILYLGSSRNQWNNPSAGTSDAWNNAADIIYNDFAFSFSYKGKEIINLSDDEKAKFSFGMYIERIKTKDTLGNTIWAPSKSDGSSSYYQGLYKNDSQVFDEAAAKAGIKTWLESNKSGTPMVNGNKVVGIDVPYTTAILNKKNRAEQYYYFTSQSGQTVADHEISFQTDSPVDDYVYRAYAYMIYDGTVYVSDATYFSMKNVSGK